MAAIDVILNASVDSVKRSGLMESGAMMGTVTAVADDGTVGVERAGDTYPRVRVLSGYERPTVGDRVELLRSAGGWVAVGKVMTHSAPLIQSGTVQTPAWPSGTLAWTETQVTFPVPFASTPNVVAVLHTGATLTNFECIWAINNPSPTGFLMRSRRNTSGVTGFQWIATASR